MGQEPEELRRDIERRREDLGETIDAIGDRVTRWLTLNEMNVHTLYGHGLTDHAPALVQRLDFENPSDVGDDPGEHQSAFRMNSCQRSGP